MEGCNYLGIISVTAKVMSWNMIFELTFHWRSREGSPDDFPSSDTPGGPRWQWSGRETHLQSMGNTSLYFSLF